MEKTNIKNTHYKTENDIHLSFIYPKYPIDGKLTYDYELYFIFKKNIKNILRFLEKCKRCHNREDMDNLLIKCNNKGYKVFIEMIRNYRINNFYYPIDKNYITQ